METEDDETDDDDSSDETERQSKIIEDLKNHNAYLKSLLAQNNISVENERSKIKKKTKRSIEGMDVKYVSSPKKKRKVSKSRKSKRDKIEIERIESTDGADYAYVDGDRHLILTGSRGGKYWFQENGKKKWIPKRKFERRSGNSEKKIRKKSKNNAKDKEGYKIFTETGKYGGQFAFIYGVKQLILEGKSGGRYWINKIGNKQYLNKWYVEEEQEDDHSGDGEADAGDDDQDQFNEEDEYYEMEELLDHRDTSKGMEYFVKWKDYDSSHNTWESEENVTFSSDYCLKKYWSKKTVETPAGGGKAEVFNKAVFDGLNDENSYKVKQAMSRFRNNYQQIKQDIEFILSKSVTSELAEFISDFLGETKDSLSEHLCQNGVQFIKSMELMLQQKKDLDKFTTDHEKSSDDESSTECQDDDNPMPDFVDIIIGDKVIKPALSPYGHVLGYETWTKILTSSKAKNRCPFTLQKMTRRDLIKLTKRNYKKYRNRIVNVTKEQQELMSLVC